ncbi:hypothetical protein D3H55_21020 [Bacillus salacetis]|uniref:Uncharacterized protein n=1 Tax=Bacillus salacetis TaxID=2315464 RepID=A0A3A1QNP8_9BACI|nr:hypothetical protein [Bacillus salacetis]RIW28660.1 hypothetical protein D3H55_21020 [Bacillus salacetis]
MEDILKQILSELKVIKTDVGGLKADVNSMKTDVGGLKTDVNSMKTDVGGLKTDVNSLKSDVGELKVGQARLEGGQQRLEVGQKKLEQNLIESLGTYTEKITEHHDDKTEALNKRVYRVESEIERLSRQ